MTAHDRSSFVQVFEHVWATDTWIVAQLAVPLEQIAAWNGLALQTWNEEGLGQLSGCLGRLPSGVIVSLAEFAALVSSSEKRGPSLFADAADVFRIGVENLITEALSALTLSRSHVETQGDAPTAAEIASLKRYADEYRAKHGFRSGS